MEWIHMRLNFSYVQCTGVDRQWNKNYSDWLSLKIALRTHMIRIELWPVKPTVFLRVTQSKSISRIVPLTTIYIFEDINWSARPKHCKNSLGILRRPKLEMLKYSWKVSMIILADIKCIFDCRVSSFFQQPCPWVEVLSVPKPKEFVDNKYRMLSQGSNFNFVEILWKLIPESEYEFFSKHRYFRMPKLDNFLNHKAKMVIESPDISKTRSTV